MIWHILKKDWGQLWLLVTISAVAQFANAGLWIALGHFQQPRELMIVAELFPAFVWIAIAVLAIAAVHQDVLPGVTQDWLIRPIRRADLLQAKLSFVVIAVHGPMFAGDAIHGAATGFGLRETLAAAISHNAAVLLVLELPVFALAAISRTMIQVIGSLLATWLIVVAGVLTGTLLRGGTPPPFASSGMQWMTPAFWSLLAVSAAAAIIPMQYFRRSTTVARRIAVCALLLAPTLSFSTWSLAFSAQQRLSPQPAMAEPIGIAFDPAPERTPVDAAAVPANTVLLPLRVYGLASESIVMSDRAVIQLVGGEGTTLFRGRTTGNSGNHDDFVVRKGIGGEVRTNQQITFSKKIYELVRGRPVRAEIEYSLTLFHLETSEAISAINGDKRWAAFGWCKTSIDQDGDEIEFGCLELGAAPPCIGAFLENPVNGRRNPENLWCSPDYAPYRAQLYPDALSQFGGGVRFRDTQGLAKFPVDGSQLRDARIILKSYRPAAHFTRRLVIPEIRPEDWIADTAVADSSPR
jgi:hypothetical protein